MIVEYDPIDGTPCADGLAEQQAKYLTRPHMITGYVTSSHLVVDYLRLMFIRNEIHELSFLYKGEELKVNFDGTMNYWPPGFCDHDTYVLGEIIDGRRDAK